MPGPPGTGPPRKGAPPGGGNEIPQGGLVSTSSYPHISGAAAMGAPTRMMRPSLPHVMGVPPVPGPQQMEPPLDLDFLDQQEYEAIESLVSHRYHEIEAE